MIVTARQVQFERHFMPVFDPVSFTVGNGELLLVTGTNGSGKTTLIRLLAGLLRPSAGDIRLATLRCAYVGHQLAVKEDLSVQENLEFARRFAGGDQSPGKALRQLGLESVRDQEGRTLSAGQRKRCALARLLLTEADLWLLDEPYSNLDRDGLAVMDQLLQAHLGTGGACVMSTHGSLRPGTIDGMEVELQIPGQAA